jgi:ATP-dependent RNA helicase RhlE
MTFATLGLIAPLLRAVEEQGYSEPSPIQAQAIPVILGGQDVLASAQTGTGKTAGFILPILQRLSERPAARANHTRVLVLTPTRELAAQIHDSVFNYGKYLKLRSTVIFGGVKLGPQMMKLRSGVEILIATPGRLLDLQQQRAIQLNDVECLVLDEADRMLDMGFILPIKKIISMTPRARQTLLFSATLSPDIRVLANSLLNAPVEITIAPKITTSTLVSQKLHPVDKARKSDLLSHLIRQHNWQQALVFSRTKHGADKLVRHLHRDNIEADAIHGNKSQSQRTRALDNFKSGKVRILIATDIVARGIDIDQLPQVVNFDLPKVPEDYVHRIGRTGRAGSEGHAISLVCADEIKELQAIERLIKTSIPRENIPNFEPQQAVPLSNSSSKLSPQGRPRPHNTNACNNTNPRSDSRSGNRTHSRPANRQRNHSAAAPR